MIGKEFSAQKQALSEFAIGSNPFSTHIIINTTWFLVLFISNLGGGGSPTFQNSVQPSPNHKAILWMQYNIFAVYPHPHIILQYRFSTVFEPILFEIVI